MARKRSPSPKSLVSSIRKAVRGRRPARPSRAPGAAKAAAPPPPVKRTSVVRKPSRNPTVGRRTAPAGKRPGRKLGRRAGDMPASPRVISSGPATSTWARQEFATRAAAPGWTPQPPPAASAGEAPYAIPSGYGDDRIVLMVKDPWWLYAYWEIQPATERAARNQLLPQDVAGLRSVLRVCDVTGIDFPEQPAHRSFDIALSGLAINWFIHTDAPGREFLVEIGLLTQAGRFLLLARSNRVTAPRFGPSDLIDPEWMTTDETFWKLAGLSTVGPGASPAPWSGNWSSMSVVGAVRPSILRGFWCRINADLVIHGATEPRSTVLIQGQPVAVRKDGSFSVRLALPTGTQTIAIDVTSLDGRRTKTVTPVVTLAWSGALGADSSSAAESMRDRPRPDAAGEGA